MITLRSHGKKILDIHEGSIGKILNIYSDEHLSERPTFLLAQNLGELSYSDLRSECDKLLIPWQLFLLNQDKLDEEIKSIDDRRKSKFDQKLIANRSNEGHGVSLRIADRLIALQEFARENCDEKHDFPGSLKALHRDKWGLAVLNYFRIDTSKLSSGKKAATLEHIINCVEEKNIRVARGVLAHKLLPASNAIRSSYRKSSGFVVRDDKIPYIFLPNEISDTETPGRQILTLLTLIMLIGIDDYDMYVTGNLEMFVKTNRTLGHVYGVVGEILLPFSETDKYRGVQITAEIRDDLASRFMLTPSAVLVTLRQRGYISDDIEYQILLDGIVIGSNGKKEVKRTPHLDTAVRKMCGKTTSIEIIKGIREGTLNATRAQYLIFGQVDKLKFEKYKANVGI